MPELALADIKAAAKRIEGVAYRTPVLRSDELDKLTGKQIYLKCENLQRGGAFKFRGAYNRLSQLTPTERRRGIVAFSSGNHGKAVALAAHLLGIPATVVLQHNVSSLKLAGVRKYGAKVVQYQPGEDREAIAQKLVEKEQLILVPPFNDYEIMAGQGTAGYELVKEIPDLQAIAAPVGGGGLISGCGTAAKGLNPQIKVFGVEPVHGDDVKLSLAAGKIVSIKDPDELTIAEGIKTLAPGTKTFPIMQRVVDQIVLVNDAEIVQALRFFVEELKLVVEPAGAAPLAAVMGRKLPKPIKRIGLVISGGNYSLESLHELLG